MKVHKLILAWFQKFLGDEIHRFTSKLMFLKRLSAFSDTTGPNLLRIDGAGEPERDSLHRMRKQGECTSSGHPTTTHAAGDSKVIW